jgi:uncharacterized protein
MNMQSDFHRFKEIVKGKIRKELKKFISNGSFTTPHGVKKVTIPISQIDLPRFKFGNDQEKNVGQGQGPEQSGEKGDQQQGSGRQAGNQKSEHSLEVNISLEELASILGEELHLPRIKKKGYKHIKESSYKYTGIQKNGPDSLSDFKRSYKEALKRQMICGEYDVYNPKIVPIKDDIRYRMYKTIEKPKADAVIIYMMDVSGSMGDEQKEIVRLTSFWLDTWLSNEYKGIEKRYIIHDATAKEVDQDVFYRTKESGGTLISSAYKLADTIIADDYNNDDWNIYLFHFSDGDNWSGNDTAECLRIMDNVLLPKANLFCYGQVESRYGSGQFFRDLSQKFKEDHERVITSQIKDKSAIMAALKKFLGKGK